MYLTNEMTIALKRTFKGSFEENKITDGVLNYSCYVHDTNYFKYDSVPLKTKEFTSEVKNSFIFNYGDQPVPWSKPCLSQSNVASEMDIQEHKKKLRMQLANSSLRTHQNETEYFNGGDTWKSFRSKEQMDSKSTYYFNDSD